MLRLAAGFALPLLQLLFHAIDPAVDLIDALAVLLCLTGGCLGLGKRLARRALDRAQATVHAVDARVHGSDLLPDEALRRATAKRSRANQNDGCRIIFRKTRTHLLTFPTWITQLIPWFDGATIDFSQNVRLMRRGRLAGSGEIHGAAR
ncbi:MAG: hypothetical protein ABW192_04845, partial [Sphingobium sp.]